jgi:hypothetical protein
MMGMIAVHLTATSRMQTMMAGCWGNELYKAVGSVHSEEVDIMGFQARERKGSVWMDIGRGELRVSLKCAVSKVSEDRCIT